MGSLNTNSVVLGLRTFARRLGLNGVIARAFLVSDTYEDAFDKALKSAVREGDIVWDVGANVGHYSVIFASLVGDEGLVYAFEPHPETCSELTARSVGFDNIVVMPVALGESSGEAVMATGADDLKATSRIMDSSSSGHQSSTRIQMRSADSLCGSNECQIPNVIKIDVEGFEPDVLRGMRSILSAADLRAVLIEVHFGALEQRGLGKAPKEIEDVLVRAGFACRWIAVSHLIAERL